MPCIFCQIANESIESNIIYQDDSIVCFLDIDPINEGHVLIIPREHYLDVDEIPDEIIISIIIQSKKIVKILKEMYSPEGYSIMQNGGLFNDVGHYHLHIFPRYKNDGFGWTFSDTKPKVSNEIANGLKELLNRVK